ncbi:hypothetical protein J3D46_004966 [Paenarthrobacter sp. A20]|nr:hypothetical protein [Paenarthrobacter sp. A20]
MSTYLRDLRSAHARCREAEGNQLELFLQEPVVSRLGWPRDVVRQMLWEHGETEHFVPDYGSLRLEQVSWTCESVSHELLQSVPTGPSDRGAIEDYAKWPDYWAAKRGEDVVESWTKRGTWLVPPLLISTALLDPAGQGWQLIEGRTRVGILRGRAQRGLFVIDDHDTWVGRPRMSAGLFVAPSPTDKC